MRFSSGPLAQLEPSTNSVLLKYTVMVVGAELGDVIIPKYHNSQMTAVSIYWTLFTTASPSSIYIVDH